MSPTPTCPWLPRPRKSTTTFTEGMDARREMARDETFYAIDKSRDLLEFAPRHCWRDVLSNP